MININLRLRGVVENTINNMIKLGIASNKTEAIRIALLNYDDKIKNKIKELEETQLVFKRMQEMDNDLKTGKSKIISSKEMAKKYPELKELI